MAKFVKLKIYQKDSCFFAFTGKKWYIIIGNLTMQDMKEGETWQEKLELTWEQQIYSFV